MNASLSRASCFALVTLALAACGDDTGTGAFAGSQPAGGSGGTGGTPVVVGGAGGAEVGGAGGSPVVGGAGGEAVGGAGGEGEGGGTGGSPPQCDGDGDNEPLMGAGCCGAPDVCDCDDNDSNVFPGQGSFFDEPRPFENDPVLKWDYDCNGVAEKQYQQASGPCGLLDCVGVTTKFLGNNNDYFCGAPGTLQICNGLGLQCTLQGGVTLACK